MAQEVLMHGDDSALIGTSKSFLQATGMIPILSASRGTVLICGETGTGKELFARAIHYTSSRREKPFVPVNCAALPDHLIENELFGHSRGAFTGASTEKQGLFDEADGGTLFLDEINSLSVTVQSKLLRVLQDQEFRPLGSTKSHKTNVKIIAATNTDLRVMVEAGKFREDLFHRLNVLSVVLPPLRDRKEDIPLLAGYFLSLYGPEFGRSRLTLSQSAQSKLLGYEWPGNVRELEGVVHRAVAMSGGEVLDAQDFDLPVKEETIAQGPTLTLVSRGILSSEDSFQEMKAKVIEEFERAYLSELLSANQGNISKAARVAKKERRAFQRLLHKHGLDRRGYLAA
ncbi:MAG TPA: sigma 54-interacting transcriptional regulator [Desulfatiglandales bacterium]|nr:sigma 54-interacting transcriptional regulator [Desulfatiglandales bacterium]